MGGVESKESFSGIAPHMLYATAIDRLGVTPGKFARLTGVSTALVSKRANNIVGIAGGERVAKLIVRLVPFVVDAAVVVDALSEVPKDKRKEQTTVTILERVAWQNQRWDIVDEIIGLTTSSEIVNKLKDSAVTGHELGFDSILEDGHAREEALMVLIRLLRDVKPKFVEYSLDGPEATRGLYREIIDDISKIADKMEIAAAIEKRSSED